MDEQHQMYPAGVSPEEQAEVEAAVEGIVAATRKSWPDGTERMPPEWHQKWSEQELRIVIREELAPIQAALDLIAGDSHLNGPVYDGQAVKELALCLGKLTKIVEGLAEGHEDLHRNVEGFLECPFDDCMSRFIAGDALYDHCASKHNNKP